MRIEISPGFWLVAALLWYLDDQGIFLWALGACALHEAGHIWAVRALGGQVRRLRLTAAGAELCLGPLSNGGLLLAALAGPAANLLATLAGARLGRYLGPGAYLFAGLDLGLCLFNLLPVTCLDGGRALRALAALLWGEEAGARAAEVLSALTVAGLLSGGIGLFLYSGGRRFTLLLAGAWLGAAAWRGRGSAVF